jgi:hypothetical protein
MRNELVRRNTDRRSIGKDVAMQVDQSWRHQLATRIEHAQRAARLNLGFDGFDDAIADADVAPTAERLARIECVSPFDQKIELVVRRHGRTCGAARGERE